MTTPVNPTGAFPTVLPGGNIVPGVATDWWVLVPKASEMNAAGTVPDAFVVTLPQGNPVDRQLTGNYGGKVTVGGRSGYLRAGPFPSRAAADSYLGTGAQNASTPVPGLDIKPGGGFAVSNPLEWLANIGQFFSALTQPNLWLRISKVVLGGVLVVAGLIKLTGTDKKVYGIAGMAASRLPGV